ncbi:hypothetical protein [Paenibacillus sp. DCT19]|uniref:hypothetical protein n=1 Tax=Paenibacillus sp. DCT19 TaxID=2211212 RepID=UPI000FE1D84F|nr:hypothetical protein [Paenibacillus sp. DCT19]
MSISHAGSIDYLTDLIKDITNSGSVMTLDWSKNRCLHEYRCVYYPEVIDHRQTNGSNADMLHTYELLFTELKS